MPEPLLQGQDLSVSYGGVKALSEVTIDVNTCEVVGLIGPNGAGKTSFVDGITGFAPMVGTLLLNGRRLDGTRAHHRASQGLSRTWQSVALFDDLTVGENIAVATHRNRRRRGASAADPVTAALQRAGIERLSHRLPSQLSHGQRVLVGVARAIAMEPQVVLMDEPAAGLDDAEGRNLGKLIRQLAADGAGILLVDHDMNLVLDVCDRIYVLDFGRLIATGTPDQIRQDPAVISAYLGTGEHGAVTTPGSPADVEATVEHGHPTNANEIETTA